LHVSSDKLIAVSGKSASPFQKLLNYYKSFDTNLLMKIARKPFLIVNDTKQRSLATQDNTILMSKNGKTNNPTS
jgi:hypothetical protein